jgi:succinate dehydrogenase hydrophobic anchor subunit
MGQLIGAAISGLVTWIAMAIPGIVVRVLAVLGISFVTFSGLDVATSQLDTFFATQLGQFPSDMLAILNLAGVGTGLNMLLAGVSAFFTVKAAVGAFSMFRPTASGVRGT